MSSLERLTNFLKNIFNTEDDSKNDMLNIFQYALVSIVQIMGLIKVISKYFP